jgi:hypothetical protein
LFWFPLEVEALIGIGKLEEAEAASGMGRGRAAFGRSFLFSESSKVGGAGVERGQAVAI